MRYEAGRAFCFGADHGGTNFGQVFSTYASVTDQVDVRLDVEPVIKIAAGPFNSCMLRCDGRVVCKGRNDVGQLANGRKLTNEIGKDFFFFFFLSIS